MAALGAWNTGKLSTEQATLLHCINAQGLDTLNDALPDETASLVFSPRRAYRSRLSLEPGLRARQADKADWTVTAPVDLLTSLSYLTIVVDVHGVPRLAPTLYTEWWENQQSARRVLVRHVVFSPTVCVKTSAAG